MTKLAAFFGLTLATISHAATLAPGETLNINGTPVSCQAPSGTHCDLNASPCAYEGWVKVEVKGQAMTSCLVLQEALVNLKNLKAAGVCD